MSNQYGDPSGNTQAFRAFAHATEADAQAQPSRLPLIIGGIVVAVLLVAVLAWLALG